MQSWDSKRLPCTQHHHAPNISSCSRAQARRLGAESFPFNMAACHHKHSTGWESRESDRAGFKFNLCRDGNERVMSLGKRAFLSPSDTHFRSGRAPRKDLSMRDLCFENKVLARFRGVLWFSVGMDNWTHDKSFCILQQQKDTEAIIMFLKVSQPTFAHFSLICSIYAASPSSGIYTFYLH